MLIIFNSAFQDLEDPFVIINEYRPFGYMTKVVTSPSSWTSLKRQSHFGTVFIPLSRSASEVVKGEMELLRKGGS